jgi:hypothetical protein
MRTIPAVVYRFQSRAEEKLFRRFQAVDDTGSTLLHSLNIPEHEYKQWAEADFVHVSPHGILVLEIKGGRVSRQEGKWTFTDRHGNVRTKSEGPFDQARTAMHSLGNMLESRLPAAFYQKICFGWGVMFPDIRFDVDSVEIPKELVYDQNWWDSDRLAAWLSRLQKYWKEHQPRSTQLDSTEVSRIIAAMRPDFERVPSLARRVGDTMDNLIRLTEEQYILLDGLSIQNRVIVQGGAGTGKTLLAMEVARRHAAEGKRVAFLCRSPVLSRHIKATIGGERIDVHSVEAFLEKQEHARREYDMYLFDEGQDILDLETVLAVDHVMPGGFKDGNWLFFMDMNNQGSMYGHIEPDALDFLKSHSAIWPLRRNCRNTRQICEKTFLYTRGDVGSGGVTGEGLPVGRGEYWVSRQEQADDIVRQLEKWIDGEDIPPRDITVLSPVDFEKSAVQLVGDRLFRMFQVVDGYSGRWQPTGLTFSTIRDFKGLENRHILLIDLDMLPEGERGISELYVGMTRANAQLWLSIPKALKSRFQTAERGND